MVNKLISIFFLFLLASCISYRNEYGRKRVKKIANTSKEHLKCSENLIDTTKLYEKVYLENLSDEKILKGLKYYLKFYENGQMGTFNFFDSSDPSSIDPKKADFGYYKCTENEIILKEYYDSAQGGGVIREVHQAYKNGDTLILVGKYYKRKFIGIELDKSFLNHIPDW